MTRNSFDGFKLGIVQSEISQAFPFDGRKEAMQTNWSKHPSVYQNSKLTFLNLKFILI